MSERRGMIVCAGVSLPIIDVRLRASTITFICLGRVDRDVHLCGPVTVFGEDGRGLMQGGELAMGYFPAGAWVRARIDYKTVSIYEEV